MRWSPKKRAGWQLCREMKFARYYWPIWNNTVIGSCLALKWAVHDFRKAIKKQWDGSKKST